MGLLLGVFPEFELVSEMYDDPLKKIVSPVT